jgi:hypothetical protein
MLRHASATNKHLLTRQLLLLLLPQLSTLLHLHDSSSSDPSTGGISTQRRVDDRGSRRRCVSSPRYVIFFLAYFFTKRSFSARLRVRTHNDDEQIGTTSQPNNTHDGTRTDGSTTTTMAWGSKRIHVSSPRYVFSLFFSFSL